MPTTKTRRTLRLIRSMCPDENENPYLLLEGRLMIDAWGLKDGLHVQGRNLYPRGVSPTGRLAAGQPNRFMASEHPGLVPYVKRKR